MSVGPLYKRVDVGKSRRVLAINRSRRPASIIVACPTLPSDTRSVAVPRQACDSRVQFIQFGRTPPALVTVLSEAVDIHRTARLDAALRGAVMTPLMPSDAQMLMLRCSDLRCSDAQMLIVPACAQPGSSQTSHRRRVALSVPCGNLLVLDCPAT